nr:MAG: hypothetical protein [Apis mellifera filamentous virus]
MTEWSECLSSSKSITSETTSEARTETGETTEAFRDRTSSSVKATASAFLRLSKSGTVGAFLFRKTRVSSLLSSISPFTKDDSDGRDTELVAVLPITHAETEVDKRDTVDKVDEVDEVEVDATAVSAARPLGRLTIERARVGLGRLALLTAALEEPLSLLSPVVKTVDVEWEVA